MQGFLALLPGKVMRVFYASMVTWGGKSGATDHRFDKMIAMTAESEEAHIRSSLREIWKGGDAKMG